MNERLKLLGLKNETAYEQFHEYFARYKLLAEYKALWEARISSFTTTICKQCFDTHFKQQFKSS